MSDEPRNFDSAFRDNVISGLSELKAQYTTILQRLDKINGNIGRLDTKTNMLDITLTAHPLTCPTRDRVDKLEREIDTGTHPGSGDIRERLSVLEKLITDWKSGSKASFVTSKRWLYALMPLIYLCIGGILVLFLTHSTDLLKYGEKVKP